jgi:hypothetical protein
VANLCSRAAFSSDLDMPDFRDFRPLRRKQAYGINRLASRGLVFGLPAAGNAAVAQW